MLGGSWKWVEVEDGWMVDGWMDQIGGAAASKGLHDGGVISNV